MHNIILTKLKTKKWQLTILGAIVIFGAIGSKFVSISHWSDLNFDVTGYSPLVGPILLVWMISYLSILWIRKIRAPSLWIMGVAGLVYSLIMIWMVNL